MNDFIFIINLLSGEYIKKNKILFIIFIFISFIYYILETLGFIYSLNYLIDNKFNIKKNKYLIYFLVFLILFIIFNYFTFYLYHKIDDEQVAPARKLMINSLYNYVNENYKNFKIGSNIMKIYNINTCYYIFMSRFFSIFYPSFMIIIGILILLYFIEKKIFLLLFSCLIIFFIICYIFSFSILKSSNLELNDYYSNLDSVNNQINNLLNSLINNEQKSDNIIFNNQVDNYIEKFKSVTNLLNTLNLFLILNLCIFIFITVNYAFKNKLENKTIISLCLLYFIPKYINLSKCIGPMIRDFGNISNSIPFIKNIFKSNHNKKIISFDNFSIEFKNVSFYYVKNNYIFKDINLNIKDKSKIAITGRSGSGKSTLCQLILKLHKFEGSIKIGNININKINTKDLRSNVTYINQRMNMKDDTVLNNIKYGNNYSDDYIRNLIIKYNLNNIFSGLKNDVNEIINHNGSNLSSGMKKVIIVLRGILRSKKSNIIIIDEPLSGLDSNTKKNIMKLIFNECKNKTLIIITHNKEILPYMDRTIDLENINKK